MSKPTGKLIRLTAGDVGAYTKAEADTKIADAKKAGTDANTNANGRVPTSRKVNGKPLTADISLTAGDVSAYTKTEADTKIADAKKAGTDANTNANGRVPTSRKVNGKPLTADISLTAGDVSAYTKTETDTKVADAKKAGTDANTNANGRVPTSRKINGKALTADVNLVAGDVSAYTKAETDSKIQAIAGKNTALKAINGWWKCADTGLIIQWGLAVHAAKTMFPVAFPTACTQIVLGSDGSTSSAGYYYKTNVSFEVNTGGRNPASYIAIGY
ncbi:hypothetical protein QDQ59_06380 [Providencia rettgeri]|uniref:gp53-like domain-containing protein n=1 Tax=Providencia rettgeri TaxID=587 RepID=UPI002448EAE2|nr:hypothetical protein [Providencia rettgeri]MDH2369478.1 hypothetical protein [Providencia rettgeri]